MKKNLFTAEYLYDGDHSISGFVLLDDNKNDSIFKSLEDAAFDDESAFFGDDTLDKLLKQKLEVGDYIFGFEHECFYLGTFIKTYVYEDEMYVQIETLETQDGVIEDFDTTLTHYKRKFKINSIIK